MANDDKLTFLEQLSNALVGQSATAGARALGEGIGYKYQGGALSDIPDVMREAIEEHKQRTANQTKNEQDALAVASGLAAMSNPYSAAGHAMDFVGAIPDMLKYKLSDAEAPIGTIAETGLKRRLQKGGAAAEYATQNSLQRSQQLLQNQGMVTPREQFMLIERPSDKWPFGAGKFQSINNYKTKAFDLSKMKKEGRPISMGADRDTNYVISARPHELGVEFSNTHGLKPDYRGKGYGQQIYQNMADEYGGGISHSGSTSDAARRVYETLGGIDTGIPSGGGTFGETRMALPTREMKADPAALAAFEQKVKEYAKKKTKPNTLDDLLENVDDYEAQSIYDVMVGDAQANRPVSAEQLADMMFSSTGEKRSWRTMPRELDLEGEIWVRTPDSRTYRKRQP